MAMRIVVALGGNALLRRGQRPETESQRRNVRSAAQGLCAIASDVELVITHGNGPQIGNLARQEALDPEAAPSSLDLLGAQTQGMIGYLIEQELVNAMPAGRGCATLLTQVEVDPSDSAFKTPTKPIGRGYGKEAAARLIRDYGWNMAHEGDLLRRVVPSPKPTRIVEMSVIELLVERGIIVICAGGGGIPVVQGSDGSLKGVEAVVDKDLASALLARQLKADALLMLTDVDAVYEGWGREGARAIRSASPRTISAYSFAPGSMGPKVEAGCAFAEHTGGMAAIGRLDQAMAVLGGGAGTIITVDAGEVTFWD